MSSLFGNCNVQELPPKRSYNSATGWSTVRNWRGLSADIDGLASQLIAYDGIKFTIAPDPKGTISTLEASFPDAQDGNDKDKDTPLTISWGLDTNRYEKSLYEYPGLTEELAANIQRKLLESTTPEKVTAILAAGLGSPLATKIYKLQLKKVSTYTVTDYQLRRTVTLAPGYSRKWPIDQVGKKYNSAQLIAVEKIPDDIKFSMPEVGEWVKLAPKIGTVSKGNTQVVNEWDYALAWDNELYPPATIPTS